MGIQSRLESIHGSSEISSANKMKRKYNKLRKILKDSKINTLPGVVMISTSEYDLLKDLLEEVASEQNEA